MAIAEPRLDVDDIQGHVLSGFGRGFEMLLGLSFEDAAVDEARFALRAIAADLTPVRAAARMKALRRATAVTGAVPTASVRPAVAMAFSKAGLARFGGDPSRIVDPVFQRGPAATAGELGDDVDAAGRPLGWRFGDSSRSEPDLLLVIASTDEGEVLATTDRYVASLGDIAKVIVRECGRRIARDAEHFGFVDGVSQPGVRGMVDAGIYLTPRAYLATDPQGATWARPGQRLTWPGQFVFGYPGLDPDAIRQEGAIVGDADAFLRNGSLLVVRRLSQDVGAFWRAMADLAGQLSAATGSLWTVEKAAATCVGRWPDGTPASLSSEGENPAISGDFYRRNGFRYVTPMAAATLTDEAGEHIFPGAVADPQGLACPFFSHVRKVNPRDHAHDFGGAGSTLRSQMLRRGVPFGSDWTGADDGEDRGLMFMSYQTSIQSGFYRLMTEWVGDPMRPLAGGIDPIIGRPPATGRSLVMTFGGRQVRVTLPGRFVTATGAGYFFAPGLRAIAALLA